MICGFFWYAFIAIKHILVEYQLLVVKMVQDYRNHLLAHILYDLLVDNQCMFGIATIVLFSEPVQSLIEFCTILWHFCMWLCCSNEELRDRIAILYIFCTVDIWTLSLIQAWRIMSKYLFSRILEPKNSTPENLFPKSLSV